MKRKRTSPQSALKVVDVQQQEIEELLERVDHSLDDEDSLLVRRIFESYDYLYELIGDKQTTIARLRQLVFGAKTEKAKDLFDDEQEEADAELATADPSSDPSDPSDPALSGDAWPETTPERADGNESHAEPSPGHGRYGADDYPGAHQEDISHPTLQAGDACPQCEQGTLYLQKPRTLVRFVGQAPLQATVYRLQRLRCHLCGTIVTAPTPAEVSEQKYDPTAASMIGLLKYGSGLPFNRLSRLQGSCQVPLAASTQWDIVFAATSLLHGAYEELIRQAAQGEVLHNDDTTVKILELMGQRLKKSPPTDDAHDPKRTGLFTSGVVAVRAHDVKDPIRIALFFSGRKHAGENLSRVLRQRAAEFAAPIHMSDGLSRNAPRELQTIMANCLVHGRRNFVELRGRFPKECRYVIDVLKVIYRNDKVARQERLSAEERLAYHQTHSQQTMDDLKAWMQRQFDDKLVEPNSALGGAIRYMQKRWQPLTLFLHEPDAPLDNNVCERALKRAILHRKNAYFYKTRRGALVGDIYMSLIHTCQLNGGNALDYLNQLQFHADDVAQQPDRWMPWNYQQNLQDDAEAA